MREIKFRVWSKSYRGFTKQRMDFMHLSESKVIPIDNDGDLIWCQYTGLKDKNGAEIYCGDILKTTYYGTKKVQDTIMECAIMGLYSVDTSKIEVIGNIYEHSHLLDNN